MMFINKVCSALQSAGIPYAVVGGYAVALHGAVRGTVDVDIAIRWTLENLKKAEKALYSLGLVSKIPVNAENVFHFRDEYIQNRNLIGWNFYNPKNPANQVDIIITYDLGNKHVESIKTHSGIIRVLSREDLIRMKKASGRPQDLEDSQALEGL
jgi:hypothetical protein